jgi:Zn-finger nucleic acid-binding protein
MMGWSNPEAAMNCPKCKAEMERAFYRGIEIDRCTDCKGIWFDALEEETLAAMAGSELIDLGDPAVGDQFNDVGRIDCPACQTEMIRMVDSRQSHIWYESCKVCYGVFFDAGEFSDFKEQTFVDRVRSVFTRERE